MAMQYDVWSVTPGEDDDFYRTAGPIAVAGVITLAATTPGINGYGYKVAIESDGNDSGLTFTIVGHKVGELNKGLTTEVVTGPNASIVNSVNYYAQVVSITVSGTSANNVKIGYAGSLALPRVRIKGLYYLASNVQGSISFDSPNSPVPLLFVATPGDDTKISSLYMAAEGILVGRTVDDYAVVTIVDVTSVTIICG